MIPNNGPSANLDADDPPAEEPLPIISCGAMIRRYPDLRPPVIDGLLRVGETMNVIAAPKVGKSWQALDLCLSVATGIPWLDYPTRRGNVLLIDNELHPETIAYRLRRMMEARSITIEDVADRISILSLRGRLLDLENLG